MTGTEPSTTNIRMELLSALKALQSLDPAEPLPIILRTDSLYLVKGATVWSRTREPKGPLSQSLCALWGLPVAMEVAGAMSVRFCLTPGDKYVPSDPRPPKQFT
ncbi:MAG: hypothetical protein QM656_14265 [Paracoccaceae bacterium]